tara:strand:- start:1203 stop:2324 length:1122 start_codon:yes stop_codon:yes gene_type:complete
MKKIKVMTILGTRPEIIRLSRVINKLNDFTEHILVHTGQNYDYELNEIFFKDLELKKPDYFLNSACKSSSETIGQIIINTDKILEKEKPDAILVLGDTNSCMSVLSAKRRKIPTFHMEAGNRCFDMRVPEEINRRIVDHTSDVNITYSKIAREYLLREGIKPELIIKSGSPMKEVLDFYKNKIDSSDILKRLKLIKDEFMLASIHREENIENEDNFKKIINILNKISENFQKPIIFSTHPRTKNFLKGNKFNPLIRFIKPLSFTDYNSLQINSKCVISDSGTISEESSILNFPAINLREVHERPEAMEESSVILTGLNSERVLQALNLLENQKKGPERDLKIVDDYNVNNVSEKIVRIILSYTDYINTFVWKK